MLESTINDNGVDSLPAEVWVMILNYLSFKKLQRERIICHFFKETIDSSLYIKKLLEEPDIILPFFQSANSTIKFSSKQLEALIKKIPLESFSQFDEDQLATFIKNVVLKSSSEEDKEFKNFLEQLRTIILSRNSLEQNIKACSNTHYNFDW